MAGRQDRDIGLGVLAFVERRTRRREAIPRPFHASADYVAEFDEEGRPVAIRVIWHELDWRALLDLESMECNYRGETQCFDWGALPCDLKSDQIFENVGVANYKSPRKVMAFPLAERGPWSEFCAPGAFCLLLLSAVLDARKARASE